MDAPHSINRRIIRVPDWNAAMLHIGDDMGPHGPSDTVWVVEKISDAYMTTDGQSWVDITLVEKAR